MHGVEDAQQLVVVDGAALFSIVGGLRPAQLVAKFFDRYGRHNGADRQQVGANGVIGAETLRFGLYKPEGRHERQGRGLAVFCCFSLQ